MHTSIWQYRKLAKKLGIPLDDCMVLWARVLVDHDKIRRENQHPKREWPPVSEFDKMPLDMKEHHIKEHMDWDEDVALCGGDEALAKKLRLKSMRAGNCYRVDPNDDELPSASN